VDEGRVVNSGYRFDIEGLGRDDFAEADILDALQDVFGANRALEGRHQLTAVKFGFGVAQGVLFTEYG